MSDTVFGRESFNHNEPLIATGSIPTTCGFL